MSAANVMRPCFPSLPVCSHCSSQQAVHRRLCSLTSRSRSDRRKMVKVRAKVGDTIPDEQLSYFDEGGNLRDRSAQDIFKGKKVVLVGVPGAFLPTCSLKHLPEYIKAVDELKAKKVDLVACVSANDAFVMDAWGKSLGADGKVTMLADGGAKFAKAMAVELDLTDRNIGIRSQRYSAIIDNLQVKTLNLEEGTAFTVSGVDNILPAL